MNDLQKNSTIMLSLPNCGTSWLCDVLAAHMPDCRYVREYFNPVCNVAQYSRLFIAFGCELWSCYDNIARSDDLMIEKTILDTWYSDESRPNFTKENFSPFKLATFQKMFAHAFVFLARDVFPPGRARVWSFYEHAWAALHEEHAEYRASHKRQNISTATLQERCQSAFEFMRDHMVAEAERLNMSVLWYEELPTITADHLADCVGPFEGIERCADFIRENFKAPATRPLPNAPQKLRVAADG